MSEMPGMDDAPSEAEIEAAARAIFFEQFSIMYDHEENWAAFEKKGLYRCFARAALRAAIAKAREVGK